MSAPKWPAPTSPAEERLIEHAKAQESLSQATAAYEALSIGEHPDVLDDAYAAVSAARTVERLARIAYTNPFGVDKTVDARWPGVGLDPALTLG